MSRFTLEMLEHWQNSEVRHIDEDMNALTLRVVAKCMFDVEAGEDREIMHRAIMLGQKVVGQMVYSAGHRSLRSRCRAELIFPLAWGLGSVLGRVLPPEYEYKLIVATVLQKFDLELARPAPVRPEPNFTLCAHGGMPMRVKARKGLDQAAKHGAKD